MIEVIHVDQGETLCKFLQTMPFNEIIDIISERLSVNPSLIILYDSEGFIIDATSIPILPDNSQLFLFRRDSVNKSSFIPQVP